MLPHRVSRYWLTLALTLPAACGRSQPPSAVRSVQEPHAAKAGPWFEGWYSRVTDLGGGRSLAVIVASNRLEGAEAGPRASDTGYIGVLYSEGNGAPTKSWTFFPQSTHLSVDGQAVQADPDLFNPKDKPFRWTADGFGYLSNDQVHIAVPGQVEVDLQFGEAKTWDQDNSAPLGPEGYLAGLPVPLHWYVRSLHSPATYHAKIYGEDGAVTEVQGQGRAHLEKNWGQVFPKAWNWLQGDSIADDAQIALGGGTVGIGPLDLNAWLAGYRSPREAWDLRFSDLGTQITVEQGKCQGPFHLHATRLDLEVDILAQADTKTFGPVAVPTAKGFVKDFGAESFAAEIIVKTYRPGLSGMQLSDRHEFHNAALEFGAGSYTPDCK